MNLQSMLAARIAADKPVRVGLIGTGKFGSMFLAQVPSIAGLDVGAISDLDPECAKAACRNVGWDAGRISRTRFSEHGRDACTRLPWNISTEPGLPVGATIPPSEASWVTVSLSSVHNG